MWGQNYFGQLNEPASKIQHNIESPQNILMCQIKVHKL